MLKASTSKCSTASISRSVPANASYSMPPPAAAIRRTHYRLLFERLRELVPEEMPALSDGAAPFAFPVSVPDKRTFLERIRRAGIDAINFWSVPHPSLEAGADPVAEQLRRHVVGLPVHQELSAPDLDRICAAVVGSG